MGLKQFLSFNFFRAYLAYLAANRNSNSLLRMRCVKVNQEKNVKNENKEENEKKEKKKQEQKKKEKSERLTILNSLFYNQQV